MNFLRFSTDALIFEVTNLEYLVKGNGFNFIEIFICDRRYYKFFIISFKFKDVFGMEPFWTFYLFNVGRVRRVSIVF